MDQAEPKKKRFMSLRVKIWIVFTLIFTPVFYVVCRWIALRLSRNRGQPVAQPAE